MADLRSYDFGNDATTVRSTESNRVLRNTYMLLALSMLPTALGAWAGVEFGFFRLFAGSPIIAFVVMMAAMFGFIYGIQRTETTVWGWS